MPVSWLVTFWWSGLGCTLQRLPFHDSMRVWTESDVSVYPTAVHDLADWQSTALRPLYVQGPVISVADQVDPFQVSTRSWEVTSPTAAQNVADAHDTEYRALCEEAGGATVHELPFQFSISAVGPFPLYPTAVHESVDGHDTPSRNPTWGGLGPGATVHLVPSQDSIRVSPVALTETYVPTAVQAVVDGQETPLSESEIVDRFGLLVTLQA